MPLITEPRFAESIPPPGENQADIEIHPWQPLWLVCLRLRGAFRGTKFPFQSMLRYSVDYLTGGSTDHGLLPVIIVDEAVTVAPVAPDHRNISAAEAQALCRLKLGCVKDVQRPSVARCAHPIGARLEDGTRIWGDRKYRNGIPA